MDTVYTYIHMYIYIHIYINIHIYGCSIYIYTYICIQYIHIYIYIYTLPTYARTYIPFPNITLHYITQHYIKLRLHYMTLHTYKNIYIRTDTYTYTYTHTHTHILYCMCIKFSLHLYIYYCIIWGLFKIMVPQNCPYAALSRTFRALSRPSRIGTGNYDHVFVFIFPNKDLQEDCIKNKEVEAFS